MSIFSLQHRRILSALLIVSLLAPASVPTVEASTYDSVTNTVFDVIDDAGYGETSYAIRFGSTLQQELSYSTLRSRFIFNAGINVLGAISGSSLKIDRNADIFGRMNVSGSIITKGTLSGQNLIISGATSFSGAVTFKNSANIKGSLSGTSLRVSGSADVHGNLTASGSFRGDGDITINDDRTTSADAVLTFGNSTTNQTLKYVHSLQKFQFSKDLSVLGAISGSTLRIDGPADIHGALSASGAVHFDSNLSINDDRTAGVDAILTFGNGTLNQDLKYIDATQRFQFSKDLNVMGSISGASLVISGASSFSGSALFKRALTTKGALSGATFFGGGLGDCNNATTSKLIYNPSTGRFSCATDQTGGGSSGGGLGYGDIEGMFVNQGGDTMTGTLNIKVTSADVVKTTTGTANATDFSKAGSTLLNTTSSSDVITMDAGTVPSGGLGTFGASSVVTTAAVGAGAHTILRDDGKFVTFLGNASTTVNLWDGISTSMSTMTVATTAIGAGAMSLRRADGRYLVIPGGASTAGFVYDPYNITANSAVTLTSCTATTGTNAFLVSTGSYIIMCGGSGNWGVYNSTSNLYQAGTALGATFGAGAHAIQRDDGTFLVFAGGNTSSHWIFHPGMSMAKAWSALNPIPTNAPTITTGAFSVRRSDGTFLVVGGAINASTIYDPTGSSTDRFGTFTSQSGVGFGPTFALADGAQALWRQDRKYAVFQGGSANTNILDVSRNDQYQFVNGSGIGGTAGAGFHAFYNGRGTVQLLLGGATTTTRYYDVGYVKGGPSTSTGSYYETECITTVMHSGSYLTWKMNGDDQKTKVYVRTGNGACSGSYKSIMKIGDLVRPASGDNRIQMKVVFERQPAKFADQEWGLRRGLSQTQYRRLMDIPGLYEIVLRNTANLHRTQFEFGRGGSVGEPLAVNLINNGDKNLQLQLANLVTYPTTINATNANFYNGAFVTQPTMPRTTSIGTVVLKRPDGQFLIIPGSSTGSTAQQRSMLYNQDTNTFTNNSASPSVPLSTGALAFKRHNGTFLIVAGGNTTNTNIYDPVANTFTQGPALTDRVAEGSQVVAMPNGRVTIIHGNLRQTTTMYDSLSNSTVSGAMLATTVGRGSFVIPKPDGKYLIGPGASTQACAQRTTTMIFDPYANFFVNSNVATVTGTGPGAYAVERSDGQWLVVKGGGTLSTCAGTTATQIYNPFANKMIAGPALTVASRYGSFAMQRPDGTWLITAGGGLTTTNLVNEKSGAFTAEGLPNIGTSQAGPALPTAIGTGALAFQRDDGKYVILTGANAVASPGTNTVQLYDAGWVIDGYYRSEAINIPDLDSSSTLSWQSPDYRGIAARVRTGTSAIALQTASERELSTSGDRINPGTGHTWTQVNFSFRRYVPPNRGIYEDVWYNGGAMPSFNLRKFDNPSITQFSIGKDKDIANFKVDETSLFRVSSNGDIYTGVKGSLFSGGADLAERYQSVDPLVAGDLVTFDYIGDHSVRRSTGVYQPELIGIVSTNPGFVAGAYTKNAYPIALVGRVPVNVSLENGPIKTGDRITSASIPGYAMKATRAGRVVGIALEPSKPETFVPCAADTKKMCGQVMVFVNLSDWNGPTQ